MRVALKALFSKAERFLIRNNKRFVIDHEAKNNNRSLDSDFYETFSEAQLTSKNSRSEWLLEETGILSFREEQELIRES